MDGTPHAEVAAGNDVEKPHTIAESSRSLQVKPLGSNALQTEELCAEPSEPRGRLKRRRVPSHSPLRAPSPSRGHDRDSGSRHRHHYRKHHRASSSSSISPPPFAKKNRRRSDAEPDHTLRGRARNRSRSRNRTRSPIPEGDEGERSHRKRSPPPSRHRSESAVHARRRRSLPNLYKGGDFRKATEKESDTPKDSNDGHGDVSMVDAKECVKNAEGSEGRLAE